LLIAIAGTVNPSSGDASVFGPLEESLLTRAVDASHRTALFAHYSVIGSLVLCGALKITYDLLLLYQFRHVRPPEESPPP